MLVRQIVLNALWWEVVLYSVGEADSVERFIVGGSSVKCL